MSLGMKGMACAMFVAMASARHQRGLPPVLPLRAATATLAEEFTQVSRVRELSDGRVIVGDNGGDVRLVVADFATGRVERIGRAGEGPAEYRSVYSLVGIGNDTTIAFDTRQRRWLVLHGAKIIATLPPDHPTVVLIGPSSRYSSDAGMLAGQVTVPLPETPTEMGDADSAAVVLGSFRGGRADTVAKYMRYHQTILAWNDAQGTPHVQANSQAFATGEDFAIGNDGWLAIVRLNPYRMDWRAPDGRIVRGPPIDVPVVRVTDREKAFYLERNASRSKRPFAMPPTAPKELRAALEAGWTRAWTDFPATIPPIGISPLVPAPNGLMLVLRVPTADAPIPIYDAIDHTGKLVSRIGLAATQRIVGFGKGTVYVAGADSDGLEHVSRHPWP